MTKTWAAYPIVAALVAAEQMEGMGTDRQWQPANDTQQHFLEHHFALCRDEVAGIPEIESLASWSYETINVFLRKRGLTLQLHPFGYPGFGVASVLDLFVRWEQQGEACIVRGVDSHDYPAVRIDRKGVEFYQVGHKHPIAALKTTSGDWVYLTMHDDEPTHQFDIDHQAEAFSQRLGHPTTEYNGVIFPMVDLDQNVDIGWLLKLSTRAENGDHVEVEQALQQNILKINEVGARAKSAVAMELLPTAAMMHPEPDLVINAPFLLWFERSGFSTPLFAGYITQEHWRNPGHLEER
ncbi:MAG TPA: hypothetical protein VFB12_20700 [Ktedonobacteraceae bacterium]|nr:hypothetical protein [Ktedonobacteraceae bacterium]